MKNIVSRNKLSLADIGQDWIKRNFVRCLPHSTRCKSTTRRQETRAGSRLFDRFFKKDLSNLMPNSPNQQASALKCVSFFYHQVQHKVRPSCDPSCTIFSSFYFRVIFNITSADFERNEDRATRIITWTHFTYLVPI